MSIGEKIQALRKQRNMSQEELANILNISRQAISKWEIGESQPDIENLVTISSIFNVSTDYLVKDGASVATNNSNYTTSYKKPSKSSKIYFIVSTIYSFATAIFLILGFVFGLWHPGWIIFLIAPAACKIIAYFMANSDEELEAFEKAIEKEEEW